jgi:hypothetical protein
MNQKRYASRAEQQRAYRQRLQERLAGLAPPPAPAKRLRPQSRPQRLEALLDELEALLDEYQDWLDHVPDNLRGAEFVSQLEDTIANLEAARDALTATDPPRGFGR